MATEEDWETGVEILCKTPHIDVNMKSDNQLGQTGLHVASGLGRTSIVKILLGYDKTRADILDKVKMLKFDCYRGF